MFLRMVSIVQLVSLCVIATIASAQIPNAGQRRAQAGAERVARPAILRPGLFFKESWSQPAQGDGHPVTSASNGNPDLDLKLYVPAGQILLYGKDGNENDPVHLWTGLCTTPCAVALRDKRSFADLSGLARIRVNTKTSGFHHIRPIVKLADGTWWVGDQAIGTTRDWLVSEISYGDLRWMPLDIKRVVTVGGTTRKIDLTRIDDIGFADLKPGSGHRPGGWADIAQIQVYCHGVPRTGRH